MHFLWLGSLFTGVVASLLKFVEKSTVRYRIAQTSLLVLLILPVVLWVEKPVPVSSTETIAPKGNAEVTASKTQASKASGSGLNTAKSIKNDGIARDSQRAANTGENIISQVSELDITWLYPYLGGTWLIGCLLLFGYQLGGMALIIQKNRHFAPLEAARWQQICGELSDELKITQSFQLVRSDKTTTPSVVGIFRPSIWIPSHLVADLKDSQIRALLTHELIHIKRRDYLAGFFQYLALCFLFIQPLAWWLVKVLQEEREFICDEKSVGYQQSYYHYANTLIRVKESCGQWLRLSSAAGIKATEHQLTRRVRRLASISNSKEASGSAMIGLALLLVTILFGMGWTTYQLEYEPAFAVDGSGITIELTQRIPNPYNGGGMAVLLPWSYLDKDKRHAAVLPQLNSSDTKAYARITFKGQSSGTASEKVLALFVNPKSSSPDIYLDKNRNLDFTDDGGLRRLSSGLVQKIPNAKKDGANHMIRWSTMKQQNIKQLKQRPAHWTNEYPYVTIVGIERLNHSTGQWQFGGQSYTFTLIDRNLNGIFGEPSIGFLAVTKADNRSLDDRTSHFLYQKPTLTLGTAEFQVTDIKPDGTAIRLKKQTHL